MCEDQMFSFYGFVRHLLVPFAVLVLLPLAYSGFLGFGFSSSILLTTTVLGLSTFFIFKFSKRKPILKEDDETKSDVLNSSCENLQEEGEEDVKGTECGVDQIHDYYSVTSPDLLISDGESLDCSSSTSEDFEIEWPYPNNVDQIEACTDTDESISDDDSLIEIDLPEGRNVIPKEGSETTFSEFSPESIFRQESLMDLLAETEINEVNEEDNLIEIDIAMGSIKCSRFDIEA